MPIAVRDPRALPTAAPLAPAANAPAAADMAPKSVRPPAQGSLPAADDGVPWCCPAPAALAALLRSDGPAQQHRTIWLESLTGHFHAELV